MVTEAINAKRPKPSIVPTIQPISPEVNLLFNNGRTSQPGGVSSPDDLALSSISAASIASLSLSMMETVYVFDYTRHGAACVMTCESDRAPAHHTLMCKSQGDRACPCVSPRATARVPTPHPLHPRPYYDDERWFYHICRSKEEQENNKTGMVQ